MSFSPAPSSQSTHSTSGSPPSHAQQLSSSQTSSHLSTGRNNNNGFARGESVMMPTGPSPTASAAGGAVGAVRRKPARRANTAERRATHNAVERQRRETLNGRFLDLAGLLPNLANVRRPSKSAIVNSSIALVHTQRRFRAIAARELRQLAQEADSLRREVNEWRSAHPTAPVSSARSSAPGPHALEAVIEPPRSVEYLSLLEHEDLAAENGMNEQERIAYEMRGGDSGPLAASVEDGEDEYGNPLDEEPVAIQQPSVNMQQSQPHQSQTSSTPNVNQGNSAAARNGNANRARAQSLSVPNHQQQQQLKFEQQQKANFPQQFQLHSQQAAAAASLIPSSYMPHPQQQHNLQQQQFQQAMQMASLGLSVAGGNGAGQFSQSFFPPSFEAIAAAAAGLPSSLPNMDGMGGFSQQHTPTPMNDQDAAKAAAWNAHLFSAALAAQQQRRDQQQQQQQFTFQPSTPPISSHSASSPFRARSEEHENLDSGASTPGSSHSTSSSVAPSLTLSTSSLSASSSAPSSAGGPSPYDLNGMPSSLPSSLTLPLHNLALGSPPHDAFGVGVGAQFVYGSAPTSGWAGLNKTPVGGGGGGMGGYQQYPLMSIFI